MGIASIVTQVSKFNSLKSVNKSEHDQTNLPTQLTIASDQNGI